MCIFGYSVGLGGFSVMARTMKWLWTRWRNDDKNILPPPPPQYIHTGDTIKAPVVLNQYPPVVLNQYTGVNRTHKHLIYNASRPHKHFKIDFTPTTCKIWKQYNDFWIKIKVSFFTFWMVLGNRMSNAGVPKFQGSKTSSQSRHKGKNNHKFFIYGPECEMCIFGYSVGLGGFSVIARTMKWLWTRWRNDDKNILPPPPPVHPYGGYN